MYNKWVQQLTESYINSKLDLSESEMILEELNETKEYVNILENVLETLLENDIITEEDIVNIMEARSPSERFNQIYYSSNTPYKDAREAEEKRRRDLGTVDRMVQAPVRSASDFLKHYRARQLSAGSREESGLLTRAVIGGVRPEDAEELAKLQAIKHGVGEPSHRQIVALQDLAKMGRESRAKSRRKERPKRKKKQG